MTNHRHSLSVSGHGFHQNDTPPVFKVHVHQTEGMPLIGAGMLYPTPPNPNNPLEEGLQLCRPYPRRSEEALDRLLIPAIW